MKVSTTPCEFQDSTISIKSAIDIIVQKKLSYLLLLGTGGRVSGILTKTDIVKYLDTLFSKPKLIQEPVHKIMSRNLKTLPIELIYTAPDFMIDHGLEHVPVTDTNDKGIESVVGIITAETLFKHLVSQKKISSLFEGDASHRKRRTVGVLSPDGSIYRSLKGIFAKSNCVSVERHKFFNFNLKNIAEDIDALIVDLDEIENRIWLPVIEDAAKNPGLETLMVVFSPEKHKDVLKVLEKFEISGVLKLYKKPLDLSQLSIDFEKAWHEPEE